VVAGYCWEWPSRGDPKAFDIEIPEHAYKRRWNLRKDGGLWIVAKDSIEEVGCIHTSQGLEVDYVGVIIGPDLVARDGGIVTNPRKRARADKSLHGLGKLPPAVAKAEADRIIKNTYRTLLTRGMRGCYVYCVDPELAAYLRARIAAPKQQAASATSTSLFAPNVVPLRKVPPAERANTKAVPLIDLKFAAGGFSDSQSLETGAVDWVEIPEWIRPEPGMFVAQVVGESMNRRIPNGSWCLFRANPSGTRAGKVVVAQHLSIHDAELGGSYTIKVYSSKKIEAADGTWRHTEIRLTPDSDRSGFEPIVIQDNDDGQFRIVAELLSVLG
jgi:uncharacterized protein